MTTPSASPVTLEGIDAQIWVMENVYEGILPGNSRAEILASLRELKQRREVEAEATRSVQSATMPEPHVMRGICSDGILRIEGEFVTKRACDHVIDLLAAEMERADAAELGERFHDDAANKYAAQVAYWMGKHDETADRLAKVMEGLREFVRIDDEDTHGLIAGDGCDVQLALNNARELIRSIESGREEK